MVYREDKANAKAILTDKVLRSSLRVPDHEDGNGNIIASRQSPLKQAGSQTVANPPTFYESGQERWNAKFQKAV